MYNNEKNINICSTNHNGGGNNQLVTSFLGKSSYFLSQNLALPFGNCSVTIWQLSHLNLANFALILGNYCTNAGQTLSYNLAIIGLKFGKQRTNIWQLLDYNLANVGLQFGNCCTKNHINFH